MLSTRVGGVGEVVVDGQTGLLAPAGDADALAEHIVRLAADPARREEMGRAGRQRAGDLFAESKMHEAYRRTYASMSEIRN